MEGQFNFRWRYSDNMNVKGADFQVLYGKEQGGLVTFFDTPGCHSILLAYLVADSAIR